MAATLKKEKWLRIFIFRKILFLKISGQGYNNNNKNITCQTRKNYHGFKGAYNNNNNNKYYWLIFN